MKPPQLCEHCFNPITGELALQILYFQAGCGCIHRLERAFHPECVDPFFTEQQNRERAAQT